MLTQEKLKPQALTCANCPYFQNFAEVSGRGWCDLFDQMARTHHQSTNTCQQEIETLQQKKPQSASPLHALAEDSLSCQLQPTEEAQKKVDHSNHHDQTETKELRETSSRRGLTHSTYNNTLDARPQPEAAKPQNWSVHYDHKWGWYQVWVGERCVSRASTYESGERMAQQYLAVDEMIQRQNQAVLAKYAC